MQTDAEVQFNTSSVYQVPDGYTPWKIRNDYPEGKPEGVRAPEGTPPGTLDAPWLKIGPQDLFKDPDTKRHVDVLKQYMEVIKEYCLDGMIKVDFVPQLNTARQWYHAPWLHYGASGREPIHGMTPERFTPPRELSATQHRTTQTWDIAFFNSAAASVFGGMWKNPNPNHPHWTENIYFPPGTLIYKLLFTNATDEELPILKGAPTWEGLIAVQPKNPDEKPTPAVRDLKNPQKIRLLQLDIGVKDYRCKTEWLWLSFMYTCTFGRTGWDGLIPVGIQWGNDPQLTQAEYEAGKRVEHTWVNPEADAIRISLHGGRPSFGWNGRLCGPTDNFISSCCSCHQTSERPPKFPMVPPAPIKTPDGRYVPVDDSVTMQWFRDIWCGTPITHGCLSADNSFQLLIGYQNFTDWLASQHHIPQEERDKHPPFPREHRLPANPRQGPTIEF